MDTTINKSLCIITAVAVVVGTVKGNDLGKVLIDLGKAVTSVQPSTSIRTITGKEHSKPAPELPSLTAKST